LDRAIVLQVLYTLKSSYFYKQQRPSIICAGTRSSRFSFCGVAAVATAIPENSITLPTLNQSKDEHESASMSKNLGVVRNRILVTIAFELPIFGNKNPYSVRQEIFGFDGYLDSMAANHQS
jgi:hypothetical protein